MLLLVLADVLLADVLLDWLVELDDELTLVELELEGLVLDGLVDDWLVSLLLVDELDCDDWLLGEDSED
jgi:hypothetical protein